MTLLGIASGVMIGLFICWLQARLPRMEPLWNILLAVLWGLSFGLLFVGTVEQYFLETGPTLSEFLSYSLSCILFGAALGCASSLLLERAGRRIRRPARRLLLLASLLMWCGAFYAAYSGVASDTKRARSQTESGAFAAAWRTIDEVDRKIPVESRLTCLYQSLKEQREEDYGDDRWQTFRNHYSDCRARWERIPNNLRGFYFASRADHERSSQTKVRHLENARRYYERAGNDEEHVLVTYRLATNHEVIRQYDEARALYVFVSENASSLPETQHQDVLAMVYARLGRIDRTRGQLATARKWYKEALLRTTHSAQRGQIYHSLALTYTSLNEYDDRLHYLTLAVRNNDKACRAELGASHIRYADNELRRGRYAAALQHYKVALSYLDERHEKAETHRSIARVYVEQGRLDEARGSYHAALDLTQHWTKRAQLYTELATTYAKPAEGKVRIALLEKAVETDRRCTSCKELLGNAFFDYADFLEQTARGEEAIPYFKQSLAYLEKPTRRAAAHNGMGVIYFNQGRLGAAKSQFEDAWRIDSSTELYRIHRDVTSSEIIARRGSSGRYSDSYSYSEGSSGFSCAELIKIGGYSVSCLDAASVIIKPKGGPILKQARKLLKRIQKRLD